MDKSDAIFPILLILITLLNTILGVVKGKKKKEQMQTLELDEPTEPVAAAPVAPQRVSLRVEREMRSRMPKTAGSGSAREPQKAAREIQEKRPENTQTECPPMRRMLQSREEVRRAFVLAEILNRKCL